MKSLAKLAVSYPWAAIAVTLAITLAMGSVIAIRGIQFNGSLESLARKDSDSQFYDQVKGAFGDDRVIVVALTTDDVFTPIFVNKLAKLTSELEAVHGVEEAQSLTNVKSIRRVGEDVVVDKLLPAGASAEQLESIRTGVVTDPIYVRNYVSADGRTAGINVFLKQMDESATRQVAREVSRIARASAGRDDLILAGVPIMDDVGINSMTQDMLLCSPLAALVCALIFFLAFRSVWGAVLPMGAIMIGITWTLGLMSLMNRSITIATLSLPIILFAVGGSYMFHVLNQYRLSMTGGLGGAAGRTTPDNPNRNQSWFEPIYPRAGDRKVDWLWGLRFILPAVLVSGLTVIAGFGALASSSIPTARDMGLFDTLGVAAILVITITFVPAMLTVIGPERLGIRPDGAERHHHPGPMTRLLGNVTSIVLHRPALVLGICGALVIAAAAGLSVLRVNTNYLKIFPASSRVARDTNRLHQTLAGVSTIELIVTGPPGMLYTPDALKNIDALENFARRQPGVDSTISIVDIIKRVSSTLDQRQAPDTIPGTEESIRRIYRDFLAGQRSVSRLAEVGENQNGSRAAIVVRTNIFGSDEVRSLIENVDRWSRDHLAPGLEARATGSVVLLNDASDAVGASQVSSLAIALTSIYVMMVALFASPLIGLVALIPNVVPVLWLFGFLGATGIPLDITTSLVATSALGLAVDNAVHMIRRYRQCSSEVGEDGWTMWLTMHRTGRPMILANLTLMAAFSVFMASSFVPVRLAGLLWVVTIAGCLGADLFLLPVLMKARFCRVGVAKATSRAPEALSGELVHQDAERFR
jgi:predicted RND superfamily exporter protein